MKSLVILGNGPSLKQVDLSLLDNVDTIGLNGAFRYYDKQKWYPTFYGILDDYRIRPWDYDEINEFIKRSPIKRFFVYSKERESFVKDDRITYLNTPRPLNFVYDSTQFSQPVELEFLEIRKQLTSEELSIALEMLQDEEFHVFNAEGMLRRIKNEPVDGSHYVTLPRFKINYVLPTSFKYFHNTQGGNAAIVACKIGILLEYMRIILVGVDCNYVDTGKFLESKYNHMCDDYFPDGQWDTIRWKVKREGLFADKFNEVQLHQWKTFYDCLRANGKDGRMINCTPESKVPHFLNRPLKEII